MHYQIFDESGGIRQSTVVFIWPHVYATIERQGIGEVFRDDSLKLPIAGFGY